MLFVWIALWTASAIMLATNRRSVSVRWLSLVAFCGGTGALAAVTGDQLRPFLAERGGSAELDGWLSLLQSICSWTSYYGLPYVFLCFAFSYHPVRLPPALRKYLPFITALMPAMMLFLPPETDQFPVRYPLLAVWALPYFGIGAAVLLLKRVRLRNEWRSHGLLVAAVAPAVLFACIMNYVFPLFGVYGMWRYNIWPIAIAVAIFIASLFTFGFLGVQLLIERRQLDSSLRAVTSGTAILNHAIKNDLGKIKLFGNKVMKQAHGAGNTELEQDIRVIIAASEHIEQMIRKVHEQTQELRLVPEPVNLSSLVEETLTELKPVLEGKIAVRVEMEDQAYAVADRAQTKEAFHNVIQNAADAMGNKGELSVKLQRSRRECIVEFRDNGPGIPNQQLRKVFEPFYTTKGGSTLNFGLGLAYCYQLMKRQGGSMQISSEPGAGTTVSFHFVTFVKS
ncbi:sensor histidine kinase [Paenibacillus tarimensis]